MTFAWPWALTALLLVPLLAWWYARGLTRPAEAAALHPDLKLLLQANTKPRPLRRHLPAALYLLALTLTLLACARPTVRVPYPDDRTAIMLAIDTSLSMNAQDIRPNRVTAAQNAAKAFVRSLPSGARVGLASFSGYAVVNTPPTDRHDLVLDALDALDLGRGTAIGAGLLEALRVLPERDDGAPANANRPPAAIILLSDGRNNRPPEPHDIATRAKQLGVKVFTVGLGTTAGTLSFGPGAGGFTVGFDAETLRDIARVTGGRYYEARTATQLNGIYRELGRSLAWTVRPREISSLIGILAGITLLGSLAASERLARRVL